MQTLTPHDLSEHPQRQIGLALAARLEAVIRTTAEEMRAELVACDC